MVEKIDQVNIALRLVNRNWEGDLKQSKTVWIRTPGNISMAAYTKGSSISYSDLTPSKEQFTVADASYFAFEVDDIDRVQSDINAMDVYLKRAIVALNNVVEAKIMAAPLIYAPAANMISATAAGTGATATSTITGQSVTSFTVTAGGSGYGTVAPLVVFSGGGGTGARAHAVLTSGAVTSIVLDNGGIQYTSAPTVTLVGGKPITLDSSTSTSTGIYQLFVKAAVIQDNNNVPMSTPNAPRWAVVDPDTKGLLLQDTDHFIRAGELGDQMVQTGMVGGPDVMMRAIEMPGFIGMIAGFYVYQTPHTPKSGTFGTGSKFLLFGDNEAISYASQLVNIEHLRLQTTFADAVRGLLLHDTFVPSESSKRLVTVQALWA